MKRYALLLKVGLSLGLLTMAGIFFHGRKEELADALTLMGSGSLLWILVGLVLTAVYVLLQGYMYVESFRSVHVRVPLYAATTLFLKRNLIGVFLPAGGFTSLVFFRKGVMKEGADHSSINLASYIYALVGILSLLMLAFPVLLSFHSRNESLNWLSLAGLTGLFLLLLYATWSVARKGRIYRLAVRFSPGFGGFADDLASKRLSAKHLVRTVVISLLIEAVGIAHLYVAMLVLRLEPNLAACIFGYTVGTLLYCFSPFLKGIGAVEVSMTLLLARFGYSEYEALSVTLVYRIFEFWLPLIAGGLSLFMNRNNVLFRYFPALFIFLMGMVNIASAFTPSLASRMRLLHKFIPIETTNASGFLVLFVGVLLVICSGLLFRGYRLAWYMAFVLAALSFLGNLFKALDYEEAMVALIVLVVVTATRRHYYLHSRRKIDPTGLWMALWGAGVVLVYGILGFYFLNKSHFNTDFTLWNAVRSTLNSFLLFNFNISDPQTVLGERFLLSLNILGVASMCGVLYYLLKPSGKPAPSDEQQLEKARILLSRYGRSPVDYFKVYSDKEFYFAGSGEGFVAFKRSSGFAVVLEGPVCPADPASTSSILLEFERFCLKEGLKPVYYRVDEHNLGFYNSLGKKCFPIGQEAVVDVTAFSLEGKKRKSLRNAVNSLEKKGFCTKVYAAPISNGLIQQLQQVSDHWLKENNRKEKVFSQGMFNTREIKEHTVITLEDGEGQIVAFLNVIPDFAPREATYDLIRKNENAPGGNMDMLILRFLEYCREQGYTQLNMGLAPFSGIEKKNGLVEGALNYLYEKNAWFRGFRGLRDFKDKFDPDWQPKFLIYQHDYDLIPLTLALSKVMKNRGIRRRSPF